MENIVVFDKAYIDFVHLKDKDIDDRGIFWVTRAKDNMKITVVSEKTSTNEKIVKDQIVMLNIAKTRKEYPKNFRRITAIVEVDKKEVEMSFITEIICNGLLQLFVNF